MDKRIKILTVLFLGFVAFVSGVYATIQLGKIEFHYKIVNKAAMSPSPINIDLGTIMKDASNTVDSSDKGSDLTVNIATDINVNLGGNLDGFNAFSCTVELRQDTTTKYSTTVSKTPPTGTMSSVAVGVYDIWVGYSYTAGSSATNGTITVTLSYP